MKKLIVGFFGICCLVAISVPSKATDLLNGNTVLNEKCMDQCLKDSAKDKCKVGDAVVCSNQCQRVPEIPVYYNGNVIFPETRKTDKGDVYVAPPSLVACEMCQEDVQSDSPNASSGMSCAVSVSDSSNNICSAVLGLTTATAVVVPFDVDLIRTGGLVLGETFAPCLDGFTTPTGVAMSGYPKCASTVDVPMPALFGGGNGFGCYETRPPIWAAQGCPAAARCCTAAAGCTVPDQTAPINNNIQGDGKY